MDAVRAVERDVVVNQDDEEAIGAPKFAAPNVPVSWPRHFDSGCAFWWLRFRRSNRS